MSPVLTAVVIGNYTEISLNSILFEPVGTNSEVKKFEISIFPFTKPQVAVMSILEDIAVIEQEVGKV